MEQPLLKDRFELIFKIGMWWRIIYGTLRIILGLSLLRFIGVPLQDLIMHLLSHEILDPADVFFAYAYSFFDHHTFTITYFLASYFIFWGLIDTILSVELMRHRLWAFPVSLYLMGLFVCYEVYRLFHTHSLILGYVIAIDIFVVLLIYLEYRRLLELQNNKKID